MRARSIAAVVVAVLLVGSLAGCSKKDSGSDDAAVDTEESTTTADSSGGDEPSTDEPSSDDSGVDDLGLTDVVGDCGEAYLLYTAMIASSYGLMGGEATEDQLKELEDQAEKLRDDVPEDLQDDMKTVADAYEEFATSLGDGGLLSGDAQEALEKLDSEEMREATDNLNEYFTSCQ